MGYRIRTTGCENFRIQAEDVPLARALGLAAAEEAGWEFAANERGDLVDAKLDTLGYDGLEYFEGFARFAVLNSYADLAYDEKRATRISFIGEVGETWEWELTASGVVRGLGDIDDGLETGRERACALLEDYLEAAPRDVDFTDFVGDAALDRLRHCPNVRFKAVGGDGGDLKAVPTLPSNVMDPGVLAGWANIPRDALSCIDLGSALDFFESHPRIDEEMRQIAAGELARRRMQCRLADAWKPGCGLVGAPIAPAVRESGGLEVSGRGLAERALYDWFASLDDSRFEEWGGEPLRRALAEPSARFFIPLGDVREATALREEADGAHDAPEGGGIARAWLVEVEETNWTTVRVDAATMDEAYRTADDILARYAIIADAWVDASARVAGVRAPEDTEEVHGFRRLKDCLC